MVPIGTGALEGAGGSRCLLWVKSGPDALKFRCPLYPRKRTFAHAIRMSALGHKQTCWHISSYCVPA